MMNLHKEVMMNLHKEADGLVYAFEILTDPWFKSYARFQFWGHNEDSDCFLRNDDACCIFCGVAHWDICDLCGRSGFHKPGCPDSDDYDHHCESDD